MSSKHCFTIVRLARSDDAQSVLRSIRRVEEKTSVDYTNILSLAVLHRRRTGQPSRVIVYVQSDDDVKHFIYILEKTLGRREIVSGDYVARSGETYTGSCIV